jgi:hypothetical protein
VMIEAASGGQVDTYPLSPPVLLRQPVDKALERRHLPGVISFENFRAGVRLSAAARSKKLPKKLLDQLEDGPEAGRKISSHFWSGYNGKWVKLRIL